MSQDEGVVSLPTFDVAVAGAGPAGAWCAHELAAGGARVAILDGSHPREKPCGGGVTRRALGLLHDRSLHSAVTINSATFVDAARGAVIPLSSPIGRPRLSVFARRDFDAQLLARAVEAGAELIPHRVIGITRDGGQWHLSTRQGGVRADWLLGADGATSFVRRHVARPFARADLSIACGYFVHGQTSQAIDVEFVERPAGYLWSFPRPGHLAVGIGAQADETSVTELMGIVDAWIGKKPSIADATRERYSWPIPSLTVPSLQRERPSGDGWLLLGDAAGLVDPITREGIFFALQSAAFAAESLLSGRQPSRSYEEQLRGEVYPELVRAARLKARFFRPAFISLLLRALDGSAAIREVMADLVAGEQSYGSLRKRLLTTLEFRLMWELVGLQRT